MVSTKTLLLISFVCAFALTTPRIVAQIDPCYCMLQVDWNPTAQRWEAQECAGGCAAQEGLCVDASETVGGTLFVWCDCDGTTADATCYCKGKGRNPNYDPAQSAPLIICENIFPCSYPGHSCNPNHLLSPPGTGWPICQCQ